MKSETILKILILATLFSDIEAVDCSGKAFHCVNSTHFQICVDFGNGISTTIDDFSIQCPPPTECHPSNHVECQIVTLSTSTIASTTLNIIYNDLSNDYLLELTNETASNELRQAELNRENKRNESTAINNTLASENSSSPVTLDVTNKTTTEAGVTELVKEVVSSFANDLVPDAVRQDIINKTSFSTTTVSIGADFVITAEIVSTNNDFSTAPTYDVVTQIIMPKNSTDDEKLLTHNMLVENITNANYFVKESYTTETSSDINVALTVQEISEDNFTGTQTIQKLEPITDSALLSQANTNFTTLQPLLNVSTGLTTEPRSVQTDYVEAAVPKFDTVSSSIKSEPISGNTSITVDNYLDSKKENVIITTASTIEVVSEFNTQTGYQSKVKNYTNKNVSVIPKEISNNTSDIYKNQNKTTYTTLQPILTTPQNFESSFSTDDVMNITEMNTDVLIKSDPIANKSVFFEPHLYLTQEYTTNTTWQPFFTTTSDYTTEPSTQEYNQTVATPRSTTMITIHKSEEKRQNTTATSNNQLDSTNANITPIQNVSNKSLELETEPSIRIDYQMVATLKDVQTTVSTLNPEYGTGLKDQTANQTAVMANHSHSAQFKETTPIPLPTVDAQIDPTKNNFSFTTTKTLLAISSQVKKKESTTIENQSNAIPIVTTTLSALNVDYETEPSIQSDKQMPTTKYYETAFTPFKSENVELTTFTPSTGSFQDNSLSITTKSLPEITPKESTESSVIRGQTEVMKTETIFNTSASVEPQLNSTEENSKTNKTKLLPTPTITSGIETSAREIQRETINNLTALNPNESLIPSFTKEPQINFVSDSQIASMPIAKNNSAPKDILLIATTLEPLLSLSTNNYSLQIIQDSSLDISTDSPVLSTSELTTEPSNKIHQSQDTFINKSKSTINLNNTKTITEPYIIQSTSSKISNDLNINQSLSNYTKDNKSNYIKTETSRPTKLAVQTMETEKALNVDSITTENFLKLNTLTNNTENKIYLDYDTINNLKNVTDGVKESTMSSYKNITENDLTDSILFLPITEVLDGKIFDTRAENATNNGKKYEMTSAMQNNKIINETNRTDAKNKYIPKSVDLSNQVQSDIILSNETTNTLLEHLTTQKENRLGIITATGISLQYPTIANKSTSTSLYIDEKTLSTNRNDTIRLHETSSIINELNKLNQNAIKDDNADLNQQNPANNSVINLQVANKSLIPVNPTTETTQIKNNTDQIINSVQTSDSQHVHHINKATGDTTTVSPFILKLLTKTILDASNVSKKNQSSTNNLQTTPVAESSSMGKRKETDVMNTTINSSKIVAPVDTNESNGHEITDDNLQAINYMKNSNNLSSPNNDLKDQVSSTIISNPGLIKVIPVNQETSNDKEHVFIEHNNSVIMTSESRQHISTDQVTKNTFNKFSVSTEPYRTIFLETNQALPNLTSTTPITGIDEVNGNTLSYTEKLPVVLKAIANTDDLNINYSTTEPQLSTADLLEDPLGHNIFGVTNPTLDSSRRTGEPYLELIETKTTNTTIGASAVIGETEYLVNNSQISAASENKNVDQVVSETSTENGGKQQIPSTITESVSNYNSDTLSLVNTMHNDTEYKYLTTPTNAFSTLDKTTETGLKEAVTSSNLQGVSSTSEDMIIEIQKTSEKPFDVLKPFNCMNLLRGRYSDVRDCSTFYICIGLHEPIIRKCPNNTVFSEINKQCTRNMSHCLRNKEFMCPMEGRFSDIIDNSAYYICVKNKQHTYIRYKLICQKKYYLDKGTVKCLPFTHFQYNNVNNTSVNEVIKKGNTTQGSSANTERQFISSESGAQSGTVSKESKLSHKVSSKNITGKLSSTSDSNISLKEDKANGKLGKILDGKNDDQSEQAKSKNDDDNSNSGENFECSEEGKFPIKKECRKFYQCTENKKGKMRRKIKSCDSDELFNKDKKKCVDVESYECKYD